MGRGGEQDQSKCETPAEISHIGLGYPAVAPDPCIIPEIHPQRDQPPRRQSQNKTGPLGYQGSGSFLDRCVSPGLQASAARSCICRKPGFLGTVLEWLCLSKRPRSVGRIEV